MHWLGFPATNITVQIRDSTSVCVSSTKIHLQQHPLQTASPAIWGKKVVLLHDMHPAKCRAHYCFCVGKKLQAFAQGSCTELSGSWIHSAGCSRASVSVVTGFITSLCVFLFFSSLFLLFLSVELWRFAARGVCECRCVCWCTYYKYIYIHTYVRAVEGHW